MNTSLVGPVFSIITVIVSLLIGLGGAKVMISYMKKDIEKMKKELRKDDGTFNFITVVECERRTHECKVSTCVKIDELKAFIKDMDAKHEKSQATHMVYLQNIATFMGRVEEYMDSHRDN